MPIKNTYVMPIAFLGWARYVRVNAPAPPLNDAHMGGFFMSWSLPCRLHAGLTSPR